MSINYTNFSIIVPRMEIWSFTAGLKAELV